MGWDVGCARGRSECMRPGLSWDPMGENFRPRPVQHGWPSSSSDHRCDGGVTTSRFLRLVVLSSPARGGSGQAWDWAAVATLCSWRATGLKHPGGHAHAELPGECGDVNGKGVSSSRKKAVPCGGWCAHCGCLGNRVSSTWQWVIVSGRVREFKWLDMASFLGRAVVVQVRFSGRRGQDRASSVMCTKARKNHQNLFEERVFPVERFGWVSHGMAWHGGMASNGMAHGS